MEKQVTNNSIFDLIYEHKNQIGKILFGISILFLLMMIFLPITNLVIDADEHFTLTLLKLSGHQFWQVIIDDVQPPLYYLIACAVYKLASNYIGPNHLLYAVKLVSIFCYLCILVISGTYLRKKYDWFIVGLFTFTIITMNQYFFKFITIRMYSLAVLLFFLLFISFLNLTEKFDRKSWWLLVIFTILSSYTHSILLVTLPFVYLFILIYILWTKDINVNKKRQIKNWICSVIVSVGMFIPWMFILIYQISNKESMAKAPSIMTYLNFLSYHTTALTVNSSFALLLKIVSAILLIVIIIIAIKKFRQTPNLENFQIISGIFLYVLTLILAAFIVSATFKTLNARYLLPALVMFWLSTSILMNKIKNKKVFTILLLLILLIGTIGTIDILNVSQTKYVDGIERTNNLMTVNEGNVIIYYTKLMYLENHQYLANCTEYTLKDCKIPIENNCTIEGNMTKIFNDNPGKKVYIIKSNNDKIKVKHQKNVTFEPVYKDVLLEVKLK